MNTKKISMGYTIVWHYDGTSLSSTYESEELRDEAFEELTQELKDGVAFIKIGDLIMNTRNVLCISKGEDDKWNYPHVN